MKLNSTVFKRKMAYYKDMPMFIYFASHDVRFYSVSVLYYDGLKDSFISTSFNGDKFTSLVYRAHYQLLTKDRIVSELRFFKDFLLNCNDVQLEKYYLSCCNNYLNSALDDLFVCFNGFIKTYIGLVRFRNVLEHNFLAIQHFHQDYDDDLTF